ncbi:MAG: hypothetical protein HY746_01355 [Elusimicrobia bacterium]|nr:hypothetical protein [Elusimicrobiota bacterium]
MKREDLLKKAAGLGFKLFETEKPEDSNRTLAQVVESRDTRLWEGFPVMLANAARGGGFKYEAVKSLLKGRPAKKNFDALIRMALAVYKALGFEFSGLKNCAVKSPRFNAAVAGVPIEKMKNVFKDYFHDKEEDLNNMLRVKEGMDIEYAMSQIFTAKQKEIFFKKLRQEKLTKTEREYFSRVIKKKAQALSNPELHRLAHEVLK